MNSMERLNQIMEALTENAKERAQEAGKPYQYDHGTAGKAFEILMRELIQPTSKRNGKVTPARASYGDMRIGNTCKVEIKSGCGELGKGGSLNDILPKADLVIYAPDVETNLEMQHRAYVFDRNDFITMLASYPGRGNLIRFGKKTTMGDTRISIQSFYSNGRQSASKAMGAYIRSECEARPTVAEYFGI